MNKTFHCPNWTISCGSCCPSGTIRDGCPGRSITPANDDLSPADRMLNRAVNRYVAWLEASIWNMGTVLTACVAIPFTVLRIFL